MRLPALSLRDPRIPPLAAAALIAGAFLPLVRFAWRKLPGVEGWEADAIAKSIVAGHGYSFPGSEIRWLWKKGDPTQFFPTAWVDPVYTYLLAGARWLFGENTYLVMYVVCFVCLTLIFACVYRLGRRFGGGWAGTVAVALLAVHSEFQRSFFAAINNTAVTSSVLILTVLVAVRYFEQPNTRRLIELGLMAGLMILACPSASSFAYALAAAVVFYGRANLTHAALRGGALLVLAAAVVAPWTIRNYATFGQFVLVRNGSGQMAYIGTVAAGSTFIPGAAETAAPVPWYSSGPRDAIERVLHDRWKRIVLNNFQVDALVASPPPGYADMNEAERDDLYLTRAKKFIERYPIATAQMGVAKLEAYLMKFDIYGLILILMAVIGSLLAIRDPRSWPITLAAVTYSAPFVLVIPYYDRYRSPAEPTFAVLAAAALALIAIRVSPSLRATVKTRLAGGTNSNE